MPIMGKPTFTSWGRLCGKPVFTLSISLAIPSRFSGGPPEGRRLSACSVECHKYRLLDQDQEDEKEDYRRRAQLNATHTLQHEID